MADVGESPISRRRMLALGLLGGISAAGAFASLQQNPGTDDQEMVPAGTLAIIGGSVDASGQLPEIARRLGIDEQKVLSPEGLKQLTQDEFEALRRECDHAGIFEAINRHSPFEGKTVVCVTSASRQNAVRNASIDEVSLRLMGAANVVTIASPAEAQDARKAQAIADPETAMIFFDGGDQQVLADAFLGTRAYDAMMERFRLDEGFTVAGSSAGAAVMAGEGAMIGGWNQQRTAASMGDGFGLIGGTIIDTHLHRRDPLPRIERLQEAVNRYGGNVVGLGLDEGTGLLVQRGRGVVIGTQHVWRLEPGERNYTIEEIEQNVAPMLAGDSIDLLAQNRLPLAAPCRSAVR